MENLDFVTSEHGALHSSGGQDLKERLLDLDRYVNGPSAERSHRNRYPHRPDTDQVGNIEEISPRRGKSAFTARGLPMNARDRATLQTNQ